jgi:tetratricopeptide (TPR) repeat protein
MPARLPQTLAISVIVISLFLTTVLIIILKSVYTEYKIEESRNKEIEEKYEYWVSVIKKHPQFPVAYYEAAIYSIHLGKENEARVLLQQALILDPNFKQAEILAQEIEN